MALKALHLDGTVFVLFLTFINKLSGIKFLWFFQENSLLSFPVITSKDFL